MSGPTKITELLVAWNSGDDDALDLLLPVVEPELRRIAHNYMRRESPGHILQTTALMNEAYIQLADQDSVSWQNRSHFFGLAAQAMRRILLNYARDKKRKKRGGGADLLNLDDVFVMSPQGSDELIALIEALQCLEKIDRTKARIVELRYFWGMSLDETAFALGLAQPTISRHWTLARSWLRRELRYSNSLGSNAGVPI